MWIKLTNKDIEPVLVNSERILYVAARTGGGSTLNFVGESAEKQGVVKPRALAVQESVAEISKILDGERAEPSPAGRRPPRRAA